MRIVRWRPVDNDELRGEILWLLHHAALVHHPEADQALLLEWAKRQRDVVRILTDPERIGTHRI
jgi:hypothetical protein